MASVISVENLSKKYTLGHQDQAAYSTLRDTLTNSAKRIGGRLRHPFKRIEPRNSSSEEFWALRNVSFNLDQGDRVGIIGRNGAGKSTLLKILSRITEPSSGIARIKGRVASLLEVGTGFHPELTGRENIFLNGAILGMSRGEIIRKFDEIVEFAEVEKFLDTPVKRYSSGMYVRLAFAVAAHLEPEILIVDEVLAVGDAQFQKKCLGKMEQIGDDGRTVIFVSHNVAAIRRLCTRAVLLQAGELVAVGPSQEVTDLYFQKTSQNISERELTQKIADLPVDPTFELQAIRLTQIGHPVSGIVQNGQPLEVAITYRIKHQVEAMRIFIDLQDDQGTVLFQSFHDDEKHDAPVMEAGEYTSTVTIPANLLAAYPHMLCVRATIFNVRYTMPEEGICIPFQVERTSHFNGAYAAHRFSGRLELPLKWDISRASSMERCASVPQASFG